MKLRTTDEVAPNDKVHLRTTIEVAPDENYRNITRNLQNMNNLNTKCNTPLVLELRTTVEVAPDENTN